MRVLVTGGLGFQGTHLCSSLVEEGHHVTVLNTLSLRAQASEESSRTSGVVWGSVTDKDLVQKTVREHNLVYHLAANIHVDESRKDPEAYSRVNVLGTENVARACVNFEIPLVYVSSCEVYGGSNQTITEGSPLYPRSPYAASKAGADCLVQSYIATYGLNALIVRPGNVFGPGQRSGAIGAVIPRFVEAAMSDQPLTIYGDGQQSRDYVYVKDLVQAYKNLGQLLVHERNCLPRILNMGWGNDISIESLAQTIIRELGSSSPILRSDPRPGEVRRFCLSPLKLATYVSWNPSFHDRFHKYLQGFRVCS